MARDPAPVVSARQSLAAATQERGSAALALARAEAELARARRAFGEDDQRTRAAGQARNRLAGTLAGARDRVRELEIGFGQAIDEFLRDRIEEDFTLDATLPIVLLPVRVETRFSLRPDGAELLIRVYPDEIAADPHEPALTDAERADGETYWTTVWPAPDKALDAWCTLLVQSQPTRAAWIVKQTTPTNVGTTPRPAAPAFPEPPAKAEQWTRGVETRVLPDRWIALGFRADTEVARAVSGPVIEPLVLSLAPDLDQATAVDISGDGLTLDPALVWTIDFAAAEAAGMAMRMPLSADDARAGFDQVYVLGVKSSLLPDAASARLAELLDAHHYSRGLAFVPQGTPTNNTQAAPSAFPPPDPGNAASFATELGAPLAGPGTNGARVAAALGVPPAVFDHIGGAGNDDQGRARAMCDGLWPATWGYFLEQFLDIDDEASIDSFRDYFSDHVRARGHYPAFRVGGTPYGLVVASSLARYAPRGERNRLESALPGELRRLLPIWSRQIERAPRAGASTDPDADLVKVLEMDASTREVRIRKVLGPDMSFNLFSMLALNWTAWGDERARFGLEIARVLGRTEAASRIFTVSYDERSLPFGGGFVVPKLPDGREPLSETVPLDFNYITWLRTASLADLRNETFPAGVGKPNTLLYLLLRHALLRQIGDAGDRVLIREQLMTKAVRREAELVGMSAGEGGAAAAPAAAPIDSTVWERLDQTVPNVTGRLPLARFLLEVEGQPDTAAIEAYRNGLKALESLPTAELERLLTETLDVCSHRLDAWITSLYAERLRVMREQRPAGTHLGAFGWVDDLRPTQIQRRVPLPEDRFRRLAQIAPAVRSMKTLETQISTGGHIHAPSMTHAAAAAVLRSGYLSRRGENRERYNIGLTSTRVRAARFLLDAVRNGQPLGAVLGYQFERGLHEGHRPLDLDKYIEPFRTVFALVANKLTPAEPDEPTEAVAARNVVDGLALHSAWKKGEIPFGTRGLPPAAGADRDAVEQEALDFLDRAIDAVADLLTSESVFQIVRGSAVTASATLDSLARGVRPPDPEIAHATRGGSTLIHRVAIVLGGAPALPAGWGTIAHSPRSRAEPHLDGWIGGLIGNPADVRCLAIYQDAVNPEVTHEREVRLSELGLRPIDLIATVAVSETVPQTAGAQPATAQASELDARIAFLVLGEPDAAEDASVEIRYAPTDRSRRSFPEVAEVLRTIGALLGTSRPLEPRDLLAPDRADDAASADTLVAEATGRANGAAADLQAAAAGLAAALAPLDVDPRPVAPDLTPLREALMAAAAFGVASAVPRSRKGSRPDQLESLIIQAASVRGELNRRRDVAASVLSPLDTVKAVFGDGFVFLPRFVPVAGELDQALAVGPTPTPSPSIVRRWLHGAAQTRPPIRRLRHLTMLARALDAPTVEPRIAQLPHRPAPWAAEPFGDDEHRPPSGIVSLALLRAAAPAVATPWVGLVIDEFTELIPNKIESTAIAFHYDDPGAEAPQAILVAVPPGNDKTWSLETLVAVLRETLELAKIRAVDGELLEQLSQVLPAAYLAANPRNDTISTNLASLVIRDAVIVREA